MARIDDDAAHILVVDDDRRIRELLRSYLRENGFRVTTAANAAEARECLGGLSFQLIVLDVMMPGEHGTELARDLRRWSRVPILFLSALVEVAHRIAGLESGGDDYMAKPFEPRELLLRIHSLLRRQAEAVRSPQEISIGACVFHVERGELRRDGVTVRLTTRERDLLRLFAQRRGEPISRAELTAGTVGESERTVDVQINRLRRKIEPHPAEPVYLQTVRGAGYILYTD